MKTIKKMKTRTMMGFSIAALMLAKLLSSCSHDEVSSVNYLDSNSIGFELSTGKTRANIVNLGAIQADANGFGIFC